MGVPIRRFIWWDIVIVAITSVISTVLGYYSGQGYGFLNRVIGYGAAWLAGMFILFIVVSYFYNRAAQRFTRTMR